MCSTSPRQVDERNVPYTSMDYMKKKKKISLHALERFFHWSPRIEARTGVATRPHRSLTYRSFLNRYISVHTSDRQIISYVITVTAKLIKFHVTHNVT